MQSTLPATPPLDMVMPQPHQWIMHLVCWSLVLVALSLALAYWRRRSTSVGIWFLLGGALTTLNEPIVDVLGKCWFPAIDAWVLMKAWGFSIPTYMLPVYMWFVGGQAFLAYHIFSTGVTTKRVFGLYAILALVNLALELPGLNLSTPMYSYYGNQPLVVANFPLWWTFCNALMPMAVGAIVFRLDFLLRGARRALIVPLTWMTAAATNGAVAAPVWLALNAERSNLALTHAAAMVSLGMGLMVCYGISLLVAVDAPDAISSRPVFFGRSAPA